MIQKQNLKKSKDINIGCLSPYFKNKKGECRNVLKGESDRILTCQFL
jgi:hypothetical protein